MTLGCRLFHLQHNFPDYNYLVKCIITMATTNKKKINGTSLELSNFFFFFQLWCLRVLGYAMCFRDREGDIPVPMQKACLSCLHCYSCLQFAFCWGVIATAKLKGHST